MCPVSLSVVCTARSMRLCWVWGLVWCLFGFRRGVWFAVVLGFFNNKGLNSSMEATKFPVDDSVEDRAYNFRSL